MKDDALTAAPSRSARRARRVGIALAGLLASAVALVWIERVPIAEHFVDRTLAEKGVPASYRVADLGFGKQRLTNVVIGDPVHPDLVADWIETNTDIGLNGATVTGIRAGHVRVRARLIGGRVSLGAIDRLLPPPSGKPFALPAIDLAVEDGLMRLATPFGDVALRLVGGGKLTDGFRGQLAATSDRVTIGECVARNLTVNVALRIRENAPTIAGPVRASRSDCAGVRVDDALARLDATLSPALDRWAGNADLSLARAIHPDARFGRISGPISFAGTAKGTSGKTTLTAATFATDPAMGRQLALDGRWSVGGSTGFDGAVRARDVALDRSFRTKIANFAGAANGSPAAPLLRRLASATTNAVSRFDVAARTTLTTGPTLLRITRLDAIARTGARLRLESREGVVASAGGVRLQGTLTTGGGGLPDARVRLAQTAPRAPITGTATIAPYTAGDARLALTPVRFTAAANATNIATTATLSGPLGNGRVEALTLPIDARWNGAGRLSVNEGCAPLGFQRLAISGLTLRPARLALCPSGGALFHVANGRVEGGARVAATRLFGAIGSTPLELAMRGADVSLGARGFAIRSLAARLGDPARATRLDFGVLDGKLAANGISGNFTGGAGQIGNVPLLMSDAAGQWRLAQGKLALTAGMTVADAAEDARFKPLVAQDVALTLAGNRIDATGTLAHPAAGARVADVRITHQLATGRGEARLAVPGITFGDALQPDDLTRLTFGVIADVKGTVTGDARIAWSPEAVDSTGTFRTANTDLAAAFGPVTGLSTTIRFTDLLNLKSAPDQFATVASINPGIPVEDGRIRYQTLPDNRVQVLGGRWPFAGGMLTLDPTLLDFSEASTRSLTFRIEAMDAGQFLQQFNFDNMTATGTFDGVLPMRFDAEGGRIVDGTLTAREGGGTLAYVGELSQKDLGYWGNFAFQALKSLRYRALGIEMNGPLSGEMLTQVRFAGISQGQGAKTNFLIRRVQRLPIVFNIRIKAPFRGLLDSVQSYYDPSRLIERNLPALLEEQNKRAPVQPPASEPMP